MPAAAATAIGGVITAKIGAHSAQHATDAQMRANQQAIDYQKQQDADAKAKAEAGHAAYAQYRDAYYRTYFPDLAANMGLSGAGGAPAGFAHGAVRTGPGPATGPSVGGGGRTLAALVGGTQGAAVPAVAAPDVAAAPAGVGAKPITDLDWADWKRYGAGA